MPTPISADMIGQAEKFLLYGEPKLGKTFTALTIPPPIYFVAIGMSNEAKVYFSTEFQKKYGKILRPDELQIDVGRSSQETKDLIEAAVEADANGTGYQFNSIIVDNATRLTELQMDVAIEL